MKTVFVDIDSQIDFMFPAGALYVPGAERILPNIARLNRHAAAHRIPVLSSADTHAENDPEFAQWPPHCVIHTTGQRKAAATLLENHIVVPTSPAEISPEGADQIIVQKAGLHLYDNPNVPCLLERLRAERYVVYGVVTEICVSLAARRLLRMGGNVGIVTDAVASLDADASARALQDLQSEGATLTTTAEILG